MFIAESNLTDDIFSSGEKTNNLMGASEMLLGCCLAGMIYGMFSGQPLLIVGSTGPLLVFEEAVYEVSKSYTLVVLRFKLQANDRRKLQL